jgi:hypothetical protein
MTLYIAKNGDIFCIDIDLLTEENKEFFKV